MKAFYVGDTFDLLKKTVLVEHFADVRRPYFVRNTGFISQTLFIRFESTTLIVSSKPKVFSAAGIVSNVFK